MGKSCTGREWEMLFQSELIEEGAVVQKLFTNTPDWRSNSESTDKKALNWVSAILWSNNYYLGPGALRFSENKIVNHSKGAYFALPIKEKTSIPDMSRLV